MRTQLLTACCCIVVGCASSLEPTDEVDTVSVAAEFDSSVGAAQQLPQADTVTLTVLRNAMFPATPDAAYEAMAASEQAVFQQVIVTMWQGVTAVNYSALARSSARIGFEVKHVEVNSIELWLLREDAAHRRGRGVYLFRAGSPAVRSILLEAPHVYFDIGTGAIAVAAFLADAGGREHALFGNSSHRYQSNTSASNGENPADPAHNESHPMHVATAAVMQTTAVTVVQLHGFGASANIPATFSAIVSAGVAAGSTVTSTRVADSMAEVLTGTTVRYPEQT
nr:hypothetical protein [Kofleriaceae bacterium]